MTYCCKHFKVLGRRPPPTSPVLGPLSAPSCKPDQQLCCPAPAPGRQRSQRRLLCLCSVASFQTAVDQDALSILLAETSALWVCPRLARPAGGLCFHSLFCCVQCPPHPIPCACLRQVSGGPRQRACAQAVVSLEGEGAEGTCRAGRHVHAGSCVLMEAVCPVGFSVHVELVCPCRLLSRGARVSTRSSSPAGVPALGAWKHVSGSPSGHLRWPREGSRQKPRIETSA